MPNWPADHEEIHSRAFAWTPYWVLAFVALWPLPGSAEGVLALGALAVVVQLAVTVAKGRAPPLDRDAAMLASALFAGCFTRTAPFVPSTRTRPSRSPSPPSPPFTICAATRLAGRKASPRVNATVPPTPDASMDPSRHTPNVDGA